MVVPPLWVLLPSSVWVPVPALTNATPPVPSSIVPP
jgi:hypothetical protein